MESKIERAIVIVIAPSGQILVHGDDLPDDLPEILERLVGPQKIQAINPAVNLHLCG